MTDLASLQLQVERIRAVEQRISAEYSTGEIKTPIHLCLGQEAIAVALCSFLKREDHLFAYYRSHGWYLAKGGNLNALIAELYGRTTGCSKGFGGSMHVIDESVNFHGTTAIVGAQLPHAVGAAFALKMKFGDAPPPLVVCVFGDGATEQGVFMESLCFAELHRLKILFVCMNDELATRYPLHKRQNTKPIHRAQSFIEDCRIFNSTSGSFFDAPNLRERLENIFLTFEWKSKPTYIEFIYTRDNDHVGPKIFREEWNLLPNFNDEVDAAIALAKQAPLQMEVDKRCPL